MSKFLSGRQSNLKLGVAGYTESKTVLETTGKVGIGTTDAQSYSLYVVGDTNITGVVSAAQFIGDGSNLANTGATLSAAAGTQRLVVTSLTSGTMVDAATDADLTFNAANNTLDTKNLNVVENTTLDELNVTGFSTFLGLVNFGDQVKARFGEDFDLEIYHSDLDNNNYIDNSGSGDLYIRSGTLEIQNLAGSKTSAIFNPDSGQELYFNNSKKFETTGIGVSVYGTLDVNNHAELDNVNVSGTATITSLNVQTNFDVYDTQAIFHNDLHIIGNLSIGGTTTTLQAQDLKIFDKDIILGVTTDSNGNDISTDITANHAGVAVASTTGFPLVDLSIPGLEELPSTYKKIMWFSEGTFSGLGTDAWLINYAVGIGSTQFPSGTRLAVEEIQFTGDTINTPNLDVSEHTELTTLNVSGVSTFQDNVHVGLAITAYPATGIVSATAFYGDGSNLENTGATLNATSGVERLVTTQLTSGTMVDAATDADLTFDAGTNTLNTENIKISGGISTDGSSTGNANYILRAVGDGTWAWTDVPGLFDSNNNILNGFTVRDEGSVVGTAGSIRTLDFRGGNIIANADPQPNGIATITMSDTPTFGSLNITGITTLGGPVTAGSSEGVSGQYLRHVGTGVTWASFPPLRTTQTNVATDGQTVFNFDYNANFLDVFINGIKLTGNEYTAVNGTSITLASPAFVGDLVEFHSYRTISANTGSSPTLLGDLTDVTLTGPAEGETLVYDGGKWVNDYAATASTTTTSQTSIHTLSASVYRSVEYMVQVDRGAQYHLTKILVVHDGTTAYKTEYGTIYTGSSLGTFDVDISGGNIRLLATASSSSATSYKIKFTPIKV